ncbi:hypothetical protein [Streptomyces iranensis]|uniref:Uncharacterized protein n=1 Tax=Streptomyces iranensis TaxID=576784 RepID=A0A060ZQX9_9ACTN|nr:hypothetical protein [Streptomyces iranensis]MBP2066715.1 hypothetical protein [Streptomyces iranensis]CDR08535.1 predicted protein [Streptomyces iranensis]
MTLILLAIACLLVVTLGYASVCAASPFGTCRRCNGFGFATTTDRKGRPKRGKDCRRCKGHGKRIRAGRWFYNRAARIHRDGTR